ncbi:MAG: DUF4920 domain-containing protein [Chitinophagales bacterium]|nr:DUF4920 domain-containing protein [Chitinophagales bacterium]MDW8427698.1 DUF4920 domain-containing protein [Chitinophagales bacterium]
MIFRIFVLLLLLAAGACSRNPTPTFYGQAFDTASAVPLSALWDRSEPLDSVALVVVGRVQSVCQAEGCWLRLADEQGREVFVDWNSAFTVPKNSAGRRAFVFGYVLYDTTTVQEQRQLGRNIVQGEQQPEPAAQPSPLITLRAKGVWL